MQHPLSDKETCYKLICTELIQSLKLRAIRFYVEPEITCKVLKRRIRIYEAPISQTGREFDEGERITRGDGFSALWTLLRYRILD